MIWASLATKLAAAGFEKLGKQMAGKRGAAIGREIAEVLGVEAQPDSIAKAIANDPNAAVLLQQLEMKREEETTERLAISAEDAKDARQYRALDDVRKRIAAQLLIGVPLFALLVAGLDHFFDLSDMVMGALIALLGGMRQDLSSAIAFFFGTSVGSADKAKTIDRMVGR